MEIYKSIPEIIMVDSVFGGNDIFNVICSDKELSAANSVCAMDATDFYHGASDEESQQIPPLGSAGNTASVPTAAPTPVICSVCHPSSWNIISYIQRSSERVESSGRAIKLVGGVVLTARAIPACDHGQ